MSAPRAISYQIARLPISSTSSEARYFLFRSSVRSWDSGGNPSTFSLGYDLAANNGYNNPASGGSGNTEPGSIRKPDRSHIIGSDVIDLGVRIFTRDANANLIERFPVDRSGSTNPPVSTFVAASTAPAVISGTGAPPAGVSETAVVNAFPAVIEVMVRVLSDEGARQILGLETGKITPPGGAANYDDYWWQVAEAHSSVYSRRVEVQSAAVFLQ